MSQLIAESFELTYSFVAFVNGNEYLISPLTKCNGYHFCIEKITSRSFSPNLIVHTTLYLGQRKGSIYLCSDSTIAEFTDVESKLDSEETFIYYPNAYSKNPEQFKQRDVKNCIKNCSKNCNYCECDDCINGVFPCNEMLEVVDGTHICAICYAYPPCGNDDCDEFKHTGECRHRVQLTGNRHDC